MQIARHKRFIVNDYLQYIGFLDFEYNITVGGHRPEFSANKRFHCVNERAKRIHLRNYAVLVIE